MIRFLVFLLIILAACMVSLGATGINNHTTKALKTQSVSTTAPAPNGQTSTVASDVSLHLDWTGANMAFVSKIFVLILIVLMAVLNYISFLSQQKEETSE